MNDDEAVLNMWVVDALNVATFDLGEGDDLIVLGVVLLDQVFDELLTCRVCLLLYREVLVKEELLTSGLCECALKTVPSCFIDHSSNLSAVLKIHRREEALQILVIYLLHHHALLFVVEVLPEVYGVL